jgi:uncharacterized damage-inducible protein DinB
MEKMRMDVLDRLLDHDHWATTELLALSRDLTDAQLDQEVDVGHRTLRATFVHIVENIDGWMGRMIGEPPADLGDDRSIAALADRHERAYATFAAFARRIRDEGRMDDTFRDPFGGDMTYGGAILHVILHDEDHRVEALHILNRLDPPAFNEAPEYDHGLWDYVRREQAT